MLRSQNRAPPGVRRSVRHRPARGETPECRGIRREARQV